MFRSDHCARALLASFGILAAADGCSRGHPSDSQAHSGFHHESGVVAVVAGVAVGEEHVRAVQAAIQPTPSDEVARRLVIDAALAHLEAGGSLMDSKPHEWLRSYRVLQQASAQAATAGRHGASAEPLVRRLEQARRTHGVRMGSCDNDEGDCR